MNQINKLGFIIAIFVIALNSLLGAVGMREIGVNTLAAINMFLITVSSILILVE